MADGIKIHRRHGFYVLVMVVGWVLPPVAVLLRFGFGSDFFLNILLTLCGYIPGHGHNFYLQNIRNNENRKRTPQWATKAGLVKDQTAKRKARTQWANRYDERTPTRADGYQDEESLEHQHARGSLLGQRLLLLCRRSLSPSVPSNISQEARDLERLPADDGRHHHLRKKHAHRHTLSAFDLDPSVIAAQPSSTTQDKKAAKIARRKTSQSTRNGRATRDNHDNDDDDDPYFIRRASSIHATVPSHSGRISPLGSPTSTKSFSQKLGFGSSKKSERKNRFDVTNEARSQWENLPSRHSAPDSNRHSVADPDGLNHQF
ncbi:hypothetical protein PCASD_06311 [Puccinia coronata f. sp. avenae]|uniref:Uncharacterized protein n=1 Tax=Puccinia coronata f. sp. avenae TaxID=200324 RepID=A0A2N5V944_9BASI|nr:hypothetical protein PCASD_06311 [Puccinia coronata f. sp. avenae]